MTISATYTPDSYSGDGSTVIFPYTFKVFAEADLRVILVDTSVTPNTETVQTLTSNYAVSGVGVASGGNVTMVAAPAATEDLVLKYNLDVTQPYEYTENDSFPAKTHEAALDRQCIINQQQAEKIDRSITFAEASSTTGVDMPEPAALYMLRWNAAADNLENVEYVSTATIALGIALGDLPPLAVAGVTDNDYAKFTATGLEGRSYAEVRTDINVADGADVTDTASVTAAGALMDSEVDADIKTLVLPASTTISAFGATLVDDAAATNARTTLGLAIGTDVLAQQAIGIADDNLVEMDDASAAADEYAKFTANGLQGRSYAEVAADIDDALLATGSFAQIKTGTYTGDGSVGQAITGVGFRPKSVDIYSSSPFTATDGCHRNDAGAWSAGYSRQIAVTGIISSLDADGFTVSDVAGDHPPNKNAATYTYVAFG